MKKTVIVQILLLLLVMLAANNLFAVKVNRTIIDEKGDLIDEIIIDGRPPKILPAPNPNPPKNKIKGITYWLDNIPAYDWCYGCSATSIAMQAGYFDNSGYPDIYTGPANGGVQPMTNAVWNAQASHTDTNECPVSASAQNVDGRGIKGHADDYWSSYNSTIDPYYGHWTQHVSTNGQPCTGDFMGTNQYYNFQNTDGSTVFYNYTNGSPLYDFTYYEPDVRDGCHGARLFYEACGETVIDNFSQYIYGYNGNTLGYTFAQYKTEIDNGNPVAIHVEGHTMLGYGYNNTNESSPVVYLRDTWDQNTTPGSHTMVWGGSYSSMLHYAVTVVHLQAPPTAPTNVVTTASGSDLTVSWTIVSGADSYDVYSSSEPYGSYSFVTNVATNSYVTTTSNNKLFWYIKAKN